MSMIIWKRRLRFAAIVAVLMMLPGRVAAQQAGRDRVMPEVTIIDAGGAGPDFDTRTVRRGFDLFAGSDAAFSGMRATGHYGTAITNYGDCTTVLRNCQGNTVYVPARGQWYAPFFEVEWAVAAPPHEYAKIRAVAPSIANATGEGWTGGYNAVVLGRPRRFGPADGTLGRMFSGVTSTTDGSCRDHTGRPNGSYPAGLQLLPTSDCPETWGSEGWRGAHPIDQAGWKRLFDRDGDAFRWDFWRVPDEDRRLDLPFLGSHHHTYGETSDYSADVLLNYGAVVPSGVGQPVLQGYPLGLLLHFDAFNFADPRVNDAYFVQVTIVNRSQDVWGTGVDYDSLYLGFSEGAFFINDNASRYALPDRGLVAHHNSNVQGAGGPCDDSYRRPDGNGCTGSASTGRSYGAGAVAEIFLKSPLGDLRNKLFTRTAAGAPCTVGQDPFCNSGHPLAGDTITFNRQAFGDYPSVPNYIFTGAKATLGYLAANESLTNDGRDPQAQTDRTLWGVFRSEDWTTNKVHYNKYVPPASPPWDYNHDGIPDTLALNTCGRHGCAALDSDTMPGGWVNRRGNIGGLQSFGPFKLAAGDTTSLIYAMVGDGDSTALWAQVDALIDLYLNFFAAPEPPPPSRVVSTTVSAGTDASGTTPPEVRFVLSDDPIRWVDPYLTKMADDVAAAPPGTTLGQLRVLNDGGTITIITVDTLPGPVYDTTRIVLTSTNLETALRARAAANLERLEIYKSCDDGRSYTADADCLGDPVTDESGHPAGLGWRPYAVFPMGTTPPPNVFTDGHVESGHSYRYAIVGKSRGATFVLNTPTGQGSVTFAPSLRNALPRSTADPNLVSVYVPVSRPAGYRAAGVSFTGRPAGVTVPFAVSLSDAAVGGSYQAILGNQILVERDSLISLGTTVRSTVTVRRRRSVWVGTPVDSTIEAHVFQYPYSEPFPVAGVATGTADTTVGDTVRTVTWYYALGFLLVGPGGPVFASRVLTGADATPAAAWAAPGFAGFSITADNTLATQFDPDGEQQVWGPLSRAALGLDDADSVAPRELVHQSVVQWREDGARRRTPADGTGRYEVLWSDDPFGLEQGLVMDLANPATTAAELGAALEARAVAAVAPTDAATATLLGVAQTDLVAARLPFTVRNATFDRPVAVAVLRRPADRVLLGSAPDTISVAIPDTTWVPSDILALIEDIEEDSTVSSRLVLDSAGHPLRRVRRAVTFSSAVLACETPRPTCNPVRAGEPGATGYTLMHGGDRTEFEYYAGFPETGAFTFDVTPAVAGSAITAVTDSALALIRVVPNPYVVYSTYQTSLAQGRLVFTHMPPTGTLRIYTVAGQLVQQITWVPADLEGDGDLYWGLTTRGGLDVASGLYLWVLTAPSDPTNLASAPLRARGKFVIVR